MMHADAHRSWSVRPLAETDLEAYLDIYLNSYPALIRILGQKFQFRQNLKFKVPRQSEIILT